MNLVNVSSAQYFPSRLNKCHDARPLPLCLSSSPSLPHLSFSPIHPSFISRFQIITPPQSQQKEKIKTMSSTTSDHSSTFHPPPYVVDDCRGVLQVYSDGSIVRSSKPSFNVPVHDDGSVLWKDVVFEPTHNLQLRLYKPADSSSSSKLPIFYYIHGGGFCIGSFTWPNFHNYSLRLSSELRAVVIAPDYRLAPENRLPAAMDDAFAVVKWLQAQATSNDPDPWLSEVADFDRVFISGDSAGGNLAHYLAVRLGRGSPELAPLRVRGYLLLAPFFSGNARTHLEAEGPKDAFLNLELMDRFWRLSVPVGADRDHPLVNPFGPSSKSLEGIDLDPMLVIVGTSDLLRDRCKDYADRLKNWAKNIEYAEFEGMQHGFFTVDPSSEDANKLMVIIKQFVEKHSF